MSNLPPREFAKYLRSNQTEIEKLLWFHIRGKRFMNLKFKRQQLIGKYIVDFVSFKNRLIVELDGGQHNTSEKKEKDRRRTEFLESQGFKVVRYWNNEVGNHLNLVLEDILNHVTRVSPSP